MIRDIVVATCLFLFATSAFAEEDKEHMGFYGSLAWGGSKTTGNTQTEVHDGEVTIGYKRKPWSTAISFKGKQVKEGGTVSSDYYEAESKSLYNFPYHMYTFLLLGYREDFFGGIYSEKSYVAGLGYHAFEDKPTYSLDVELGYGKRISKKVTKTTWDYDPGYHLALIGQYKFSDDDYVDLILSGEFGNDDDYIKKELAWKHVLLNNLNVELSLESRTLTKPEFGKVATDETFTGKVGYEF